MSKCETCKAFFKISENADDFESGKGDCVIESKDDKGKYWASKPVFGDSPKCTVYGAR
jgi:benzylsuccinate synthase